METEIKIVNAFRDLSDEPDGKDDVEAAGLDDDDEDLDEDDEDTSKGDSDEDEDDNEPGME